MVNDVTLALYLLCHHGNWDDFVRDSRFTQRVAFEKGIPITLFFSGIELDAIVKHRDAIWSELWFDLVGAIQSDHFINPRTGRYDPHKPELGIMTFNHVPLVQPWLEDQREYLEGILPEQIPRSIAKAEHEFWKTPVTFHPPDGVYAPAAAYKLKQHGLDTVIVSGEFLGDDRHAKGILYWASGLRHLMRTNDIQPQDPQFCDARHFVDAVEAYGHEHDIGQVVVGCDIDEFNGMRGMGLHDGIARLCCIGDEVYRRYGRVKMINCNAASYWNLHQTDIENIWPWNHVHAMQNGTGDLSWMLGDRNDAISHVVKLIGRRYREGWDVRQAKEHLYMAADSACRHQHFGHGLTNHFWGNIDEAIRFLQG
ncbi:hypothetical protein HYX02_02400 [Candidatus Woesearchaeota archaeon]|nr:hypothetical protein [Candidatus Woesearchaeota archaeon]